MIRTRAAPWPCGEEHTPYDISSYVNAPGVSAAEAHIKGFSTLREAAERLERSAAGREAAAA
jgi:hypothetical protein